MGQAVHVSRQQVHLVIALQHVLGRHLALATMADGLLQLCQAGAVDKPGRLGQVGRAHGFHAVTLRTMTRHAGGAEGGLAGCQVGGVVGGQRQLGQVVAHVSGDVFHPVLAQHFTPGRHRRVATVQDGGLDGLGRTAPAPVAVRQVGEAIGALGVRAVAYRAVGGEQATAHLQCLRVLGHFFYRHGRELGEDRPEPGVGLGHFLVPFLGLGPAVLIARQYTFPVAQARVEDQVADGKHQGAGEQHEPPLGQRVIVFLDTVEGVAHGLVDAALGLALASADQQPGQADEAAQGQYADPCTPERSHGRVLLVAGSA